MNGEWLSRLGFVLNMPHRSDNDMYDHMNNSIYSFLSVPPSFIFSFCVWPRLTPSGRYDSIVNTYLIEHCGLHPPTSPQYGMVVHSQNDYFGSISFPAVAELALRVNQLGKSSVRYEIALFAKGVDEVKAVGEFVHVFVDRDTARPCKDGMPQAIRQGLSSIHVGSISSKI